MTDLDKLLSGITEANRHGEFAMGQVEIPDDIRETVRKVIEQLEEDAIDSDGQGYGLTSPDAAAEIIASALLAERERATRVQIEKDAAIAHETVKPIMAGNFGLVHVAEIGRQIAEAIRSQLTGG